MNSSKCRIKHKVVINQLGFGVMAMGIIHSNISFKIYLIGKSEGIVEFFFFLSDSSFFVT